MLHSRRRFLKLSAVVLSAPAVAHSAFAETAWPAAKPIRAIVPFSAGSTIDILGRIVLDPVSRQLGQTIVVEIAAAPAAASVRQPWRKPSPMATRC
jgi:tripartite-type tricarboxylate transporter receptor subunit TctC